MSATAEWDNSEHTIIRQTIEGEWTWDELDEVDRKTKEYLDGASQQTHIICIIHNTKIPNNTLARMRKISEYSGFSHANAGLIIVVASVPLAGTALEIGSRVYGPMRNIKIVKTVEEAHDLIEKHSKAA